MNVTDIVNTFPTAHLINKSGGLPVEVSLIAQLGHGAGDHLFASISTRQQRHGDFVNDLDEPSVKLGGVDLQKGDATSLYSFTVGAKGHPFHKHAGHRIFTAISGSGGAQLRFSTVTSQDMADDPQNFINAMRFINIPADCLFTVRFGGDTWHQFWPLTERSSHPVLCALSAHTNELGGTLPDDIKNKVETNTANISVLTDLLPDTVTALLHSNHFKPENIPTTTLSLDAADGTMHRKACNGFRAKAGKLRGAWGSWRRAGGFITQSDVTQKTVRKLRTLPSHLLLRKQLTDKKIHHEDMFILDMKEKGLGAHEASVLLERMLEGFLINVPKGVSRLMAVRNIIVTPLGLRTSPLGCPVSSLLSDDTSNLFAEKYPVLAQNINNNMGTAQVILGANDKHLMFRSCVAVEIISEHHVRFSLANRIHCKNLFGKCYMALIDYVHRHYISPTMLIRSTDYVISHIPAP